MGIYIVTSMLCASCNYVLLSNAAQLRLEIGKLSHVEAQYLTIKVKLTPIENGCDITAYFI